MSFQRINSCPCCQSDIFTTWLVNPKVEKVLTWKDFFYNSSKSIKDILVCDSCKYRFINTIEPNYKSYYEEQKACDNASQDTFRQSYFRKIKNRLTMRFPELPKEPSILDIGCGGGGWLEQWENSGNLFGSEYSAEHALTLKKKKITVLDSPQIREREFDIISLFDVLEHVEDPYVFLEELYPSLASGGVLIVGIPDMGKFIARILNHRYYLVCPMHFSYFQRHSINLLLSRLFESKAIYAEKSPTMNTDLQGISRWLSFFPQIPGSLNFSIPIPYKASLICFAKKG